MKTLMAPHAPMVVSPPGNGIIKSDRRASKPLMEKRRRERINKSLNELKSILLDALRKDSTCHSKLEKADILEMTVRYLRSIQRQRMTATMGLDPTIINKYRAGYAECKAEVSKFLEKSDNMRTDVRSRLMSHLGSNTYATQASLMANNQHGQLIAGVPGIHVGTAMGPVPMSPNNQMNAIAAVAAAMHENARNQSQHHVFPISPSTSPDEQYSGTGYLSSGECSPECHRSPSSLSPLSTKRNYHPLSPEQHRSEARVPDGFGRFPHSPRFVEYGQVDERVLSSPSDYASSDFQYSPPERHADKFHFHGAPNSKRQEALDELAIKIEPKSPLSDREGPVWRPW